MITRTRLLAFGLAGAIALLGACGSDDEKSDSSAPAEPTGTGQTAEFNDADIAFAQGMIPHHRQAVEMSTIALDPQAVGADQVRDLATRIKTAQDGEIEMMTQWLSTWGASSDSPTTDDHGMSDEPGMAGGAGMMTADEMAAMREAHGAEFDRMWTEMMIRHHEGAIAMANEELSNGSNIEALELARTIIAAQQREIDEMKSFGN